MSYLIRKITSAMQGNDTPPAFSFETILWGLSLIYGGLTRLKATAFELRPAGTKRLPVAVISVGNMTVGGTGKTPMTLYLARLVRSFGYRVTVLSRGYKGEFEKTGGIVSDGRTLQAPPEKTGDEPFMIARALKEVPVLVGKNRFEAGLRALAAFSPEVLILDDAFQHIQLHRDINLLLVDQTRPFGNCYLLPRGPLREPVSAIRRADIIVETRCRPENKSAPELLHAVSRYAPHTPMFQAQIESIPEAVIPGENAVAETATRLETTATAKTLLKGKRVFAFSGLADNSAFYQSLAGMGCQLAATAAFPDHHWFTEQEVVMLQHQARNVSAELIVTTQKDICRIRKSGKWPANLAVLGIQHDLGHRSAQFHDLIRKKLSDLMDKSNVNSRLTIFGGRVI